MISSAFNSRFSLRSLIGIGLCAVVLCFEFVELQVEASPLPTPTGLNYQALLTPSGKPSAVTILNSTYTPNVQVITTDITEVDVFPESVGHILIEVPGPILTPDPALPPTDGVYRSPSQVWAQYNGPDLQIVLKDVRLRPLADPPPVVTTAGADEVENFQMMATGTMIITMGGSPGDPVPVEWTGPAETRVLGKAGQTTGSFQAEIVSMSLSGEVPGLGTIEMRESTQLPSQGRVSIEDAESDFFIDSFFDVFTELSVDGGQNWIASSGSVRVELVQPWLIPAVGPSEVHVFFEGTQEGQADDDDMDGFDEVETQIVAMDLRGHSVLGPVSIGLRADLTSSGQIAELTNQHPGTLEVAPFDDANVPAESFFDVWPEIRIGDQVFNTAGFLPLQTVIAHKPPQNGERYVNPYLQPVKLVDSNTGEGSGIFIARQLYQPAPTIEQDYFPESQMYIRLQLPTAELCNVALKGPSSVDVYFEGIPEGNAVDDNLNGRDEVTTQMKTLQLVGYHPTLGTVYMNLNSQQLTLGQIEETSNIQRGRLDLPPFAGAGTAESFFDVFFEIQIPAMGLTLQNEGPMHISTIITYKPPGSEDLYENLQEIELYDETGQSTGIFLTASNYRTNPCVRCSDFDENGTTDTPDLRELADNWLWVESAGDTYNAVDLNCDWTVTFQDFAVLAGNWMQPCP
jgi:hypothetical protein